MTKLIIIDYGVGNLGSLIHACDEANCEPIVINSGVDLETSTEKNLDSKM
jgi:imidazoleglycerol phosphate synthase glutamine amidotransferase subunit HisH